MEQRLQKVISDYGIASRRAAEKLIVDGQVTVNGHAAELGDRADPDIDDIAVSGKSIKIRPERVYIMAYKPVGYVTTMSDEKGRKTVRDLVKGVGTTVYPVGRLDINSEGLLIMTNDGELTNRLTHPSFRVCKTYRVWTKGRDIRSAAEELRGDMEIDGQKLVRAKVEVVKGTDSVGIIDITISEGKNRQIRKMCQKAGLQITRLMRISESGIKLGSLAKGQWRYLTKEEVCHLKSV